MQNSRSTTPAVVVLGAQRRESLAVIRSLGMSGYHVIVARCGSAGQGEHSRYRREVWPLPHLTGPTAGSACLELCRRLNERPDVGWLFPVGDDEIAFCHEHAAELPAGVRCVAASATLTRQCQSKQHLLETARTAGVRVEHFVEIASGRELLNALADVGTPCVIKPLSGRDTLAGNKAAILASDDDVLRAVDAFGCLEIPLVVQRYARGTRHNVYFLAEQGRMLASRQVRILRTDRLDGTGLAVDGISVPLNPDLKKDCQRLLSALNYHGAGCAQFLIDDDSGERTFLEINSRIGANSAIACACGFDVPRLFLELLHSGSDGLDLPSEQYPVRRYAWLMGDLHGLAVARRSHAIGPLQAVAWLARAIWTTARADLHISWQWSDPMPSLSVLSAKCLSSWKRREPRATPATAKSIDVGNPRPTAARSESCHVAT